jgi:transposase-like protein
MLDESFFNEMVNVKGLGLHEILREAARDVIRECLNLEARGFVDANQSLRLPDGRQRVVLRGCLEERPVLTANGPVPVAAPRVVDLKPGDGKISFNSKLLPRYMKRLKDVEDFIPFLYLAGVSTTQFSDVLRGLFGEGCKGLSATNVSRLIHCWGGDYEAWQKRDLSEARYAYLWADGVYFGVRSEKENACVMAVIGACEDGRKELVGMAEGFSENADSWRELFASLKGRGMRGPALTVGDSGLGLWAGLKAVFPDSRAQACWRHKTGDVMKELPKSKHAMAAMYLRNVYRSASRDEAVEQIRLFSEVFSPKYPKAAATVERRKADLLSFYDFPASHWAMLRTSNPIESVFSGLRLRTGKMRGMCSRKTIGSLVWKLCGIASSRFNRLPGAGDLRLVLDGRRFRDGVLEEKGPSRGK